MRKNKTIITLSIILTASFLISCSESNLGTVSNDEKILAETIQAISAKQQESESPEKISADFKEMMKKVAEMSRAEIDSLSDEEILKLGEPIRKATEHTVTFDPETLNRLREATQPAAERQQSLTKTEHTQITQEITSILNSSASTFETRNYNAEDVREMLTIISGGGTANSSALCSLIFNVQGSTIYLAWGDNFDLANAICAAGSTFNILLGTHTGQSVTGSKNGNTWTGYGAVLDGQQSKDHAFLDGMTNNIFSWFTIKNYRRHGIVSEDGSTNVLIAYMTFKNIAPSYCKNICGQNEGAIMYIDSENITVLNSDFENVASGIRFRDSNGPLVVKFNEALNSGRNFLQCDNCSGGGIRINRNSMDHTAQYGNKVLEDWINIYKSHGLSNNRIQVNNNRARTNATGNGVSTSGSFIILGDWGGTYQEAINNIGVNPGQVGIGAASGVKMVVKNNKMYSQLVNGISNVAYYSDRIPQNAPVCYSHVFEDNVANWIYGFDPNSTIYG